MMNHQFTPEDLERVENNLTRFIGTDLNSLLDKIETHPPTGIYLKGNGVYSSIQQARESDDPNLPMGDWQHNLKVADWEQVTQLSVDALTTKSKDLQIGIWLAEAQLYQHGFAGLASSLLFLTRLIEDYWDKLYPQIEDGDLEYRNNIFAWLNNKFQPIIRQLPITQCQGQEQFCWADWEMAVHHEQLSDKEQARLSNLTRCQHITQAMVATPIDFYRQMIRHISDCLHLLEGFSQLLEQKCQQHAPSFVGLMDLLKEIRETTAAQVQHKGLFVAPPENDQGSTGDTDAQDGQHVPPSGGRGGPITNREMAYAQLAEAAEFLMREDSHSPSPYLVFKAIEWGKLNTSELYEELFVRYQGQLNIFEILGLEANKQ